jgi:hypothetical protein
MLRKLHRIVVQEVPQRLHRLRDRRREEVVLLREVLRKPNEQIERPCLSVVIVCPSAIQRIQHQNGESGAFTLNEGIVSRPTFRGGSFASVVSLVAVFW